MEREQEGQENDAFVTAISAAIRNFGGDPRRTVQICTRNRKMIAMIANAMRNAVLEEEMDHPERPLENKPMGSSDLDPAGRGLHGPLGAHWGMLG